VKTRNKFIFTLAPILVANYFSPSFGVTDTKPKGPSNLTERVVSWQERNTLKYQSNLLTLIGKFLLLSFLSCASGITYAESMLTHLSASKTGNFTCGIMQGGQVICWGDNSSGQATPPMGSFVSVSLGQEHACGIKTDGSVACWGNNDDKQATPPSGTFINLALGDGYSSYSCGLKTDKKLACWGDVRYVPEEEFEQVSAVSSNICGIKSKGEIVCWNSSSDYSSLNSNIPISNFTQLTVGSFNAYVCAVKLDNSVACWGENNEGQATPPTGTFSQVSAGYEHTCGIKTDGTITCWGKITNAPEGYFSEVSAGKGYNCAIKTDGNFQCWGEDINGRAVVPHRSFIQIKAGHLHACGIRPDNSVSCWGNTEMILPQDIQFIKISGSGNTVCGIKTDGTLQCWARTFDSNSDGEVSPPPGQFVDISVGSNHSCGIRTDGTLACWGNNDYGQARPPSGTYIQVSAGGDHTCAIQSDAQVKCWGTNLLGETDAPIGESFVQISVSPIYDYDASLCSCGIKTDGTLKCWGSSDCTPPSGTFIQIEQGRNHICALRTDNTAICWVSDSYSLAGISGETNAPAGVFTQVTAGNRFSCGLRPNGSVECWGKNDYGQSTPPGFGCGSAEATLSPEMQLQVPVARFGTDIYRATLNFEPIGDQLFFRLANTSLHDYPPTPCLADAAVFPDLRLHLPVVRLGTDYNALWADLEYTGEGLFKVVNYGPTWP